MYLIPARIAQVVLHVADDRVLPIEKIHGAVRADLDGVGPEIRVAGIDNRLDFDSGEARALVADLVLKNALETDDVGDEVVALDIIGEVPATQNGGARRRARALVEYRLHFWMLARIVDVAGKRRRI